MRLPVGATGYRFHTIAILDDFEAYKVYLGIYIAIVSFQEGKIHTLPLLNSSEFR